MVHQFFLFIGGKAAAPSTFFFQPSINSINKLKNFSDLKKIKFN